MGLKIFLPFTSSLPVSALHVNSLPDECLLLIFDRIPLAELIGLGRVCSQWAMLLRSATARRHTLVLIIGKLRLDKMRFAIPFNDDLDMDSFNGDRPYYTLPLSECDCLRLPSLAHVNHTPPVDVAPSEEYSTEMARFKRARQSAQLATYFADLLPNVSTLLVIHPECTEAELQSVVGLLGCWSLFTVKLWLRTKDIDERYMDLPKQHPVGTLLQNIINQKDSLQRLTLDLQCVQETHDEFDDNQEIQFAFPVESYSFIAQLKLAKLYLGYYDALNTIWRTVHRLDSTNLDSIGLGNRADLFVNSVLNRQFRYAHKVRQLYSYQCLETVAQLGSMCCRFDSLTRLGLAWRSNITFTELVLKLALLPQLAYLDLTIYFEHQPVNAFALVGHVARTVWCGVQEGKKMPLSISLPQVKILRFQIAKRSHHDFESFPSVLFPSVESIIVDKVPSTPPVDECIICRHVNVNRPPSLAKANLCDQLLRHSLRNQFAQSTTISCIRFYPTPFEHGTISKFVFSLLAATVVMLLCRYAACAWLDGLANTAHILIHSNSTDQNLKQSLNVVESGMAFTELTYFYWTLARFGCLLWYIEWLQYDHRSRKIVILYLLEYGSYATALLQTLVTSHVNYLLSNAILLMPPSEMAPFRYQVPIHALLMVVFSLMERGFGLYIGRVNSCDNGTVQHSFRMSFFIFKLNFTRLDIIAYMASSRMWLLSVVYCILSFYIDIILSL